jgi:hypothetical protein
VGATLAVGYTNDGQWNHVERNVMGVGLYSDTSATNATAGNNVSLTTAGTPPTLAANQTMPMLIIDGAASTTELVTINATNPGAKTVQIQKMVNNHNGSVTALVLRSPIPQVNAAPTLFGGFGIPAEAGVVFSGLEGTNNNMLFSVEKDVNGAGLTAIQGTTGAGMSAEVPYGIFRTWANRAGNTTDKTLNPITMDLAGNLNVGVHPPGLPVYATAASGGAAAASAALAAVANKMNYLDGFDIDGLGATAGASVALTITGALGGTLTYNYGVPAGVTVPVRSSYRFNPPLQALAVNTAITVAVASFGAGNTASSMNVYGHLV